MSAMRLMTHARLAAYAAATLLALAAPSASAVEIGDSTNDVLTELGVPAGKMAMSGTDILIYDNGTVSFRDGKVVAIDLTELESARAEKEKRRKEDEEFAKNRAEAIAAASAAGKAEMDSKLKDPKFKDVPVGDRLAYWTDLQQRYPGLDVSAQIAGCEAEIAQAGAVAKSAADIEVAKKRIAEIFKEIDVHKKTLYAADRSSSKTQRRHARYELRRLVPELNALLRITGEKVYVLDALPPEEPEDTPQPPPPWIPAPTNSP